MELLYSFFPAEQYNITLVLSVISCDELLTEQSNVHDADSTEQIASIIHEEKAEGILDSILKIFTSEEVSHSTHLNNENNWKRISYLQNQCQTFLHFNINHDLSLVCLTLISVFLVTSMVIASVCLFSKLWKANHNALKTAHIGQEIHDCESTELLKLSAINKSDEYESRERGKKDIYNNKVFSPLLIDIPKVNIRQLKMIECHPSLENVLEETVDFFFKELDQSLEMGMCLPSEKGDFGEHSLSSSSDIHTLRFPLLARRGLHHNHNSAQSLGNLGQRKVSETASKYWIYFKKFRKQMSWVYPDTDIDFRKFERVSQFDNNLASIAQFMHQRCNIRPKQWNTSTCIVDYILFLLGLELTELSHETDGLLKFIGFEGTGSAVSGTMVGTVNKFDVLLVISISGCSEICILHNEFSEDVPPGHVIIGLKECGDSKNVIKCCRKTCIHGLSSFYLLPQQVEDLVEDLVKKAVLKLHRDHKNKIGKLPFKFQMSPSRKFVINFDTRMLQELGLGIGEIAVKLIPAVSIYVPQFDILPPLYVVPLQKHNAIVNQENVSVASNFLSHIVRNQSTSDLVWEIFTEKLQIIIIQNIESRFLLSGVRSYHRECLMILQALFSNISGSNLLNKGEIDGCILDTVVSFLLQESPPSSWTLDNISDRISDAVHFLKSAYQNAWLPKFVICNSNLTEKFQCLERMSSLLSGRQQNMLVDVTDDAAMKVVHYIDQRLKEAGLTRCMKPKFSSHMRQYEFFMFG